MTDVNGDKAQKAQLVDAIYKVAHEAMVDSFNRQRHQIPTLESRLENLRAEHEGTSYEDKYTKLQAKKERQIPSNIHPGELQGLIDGARAIVLPWVQMVVEFNVPEEFDSAIQSLSEDRKMHEAKTAMAIAGLKAARNHYLELKHPTISFKSDDGERQR